jgi:hypothetical protein
MTGVREARLYMFRGSLDGKGVKGLNRGLEQSTGAVHQVSQKYDARATLVSRRLTRYFLIGQLSTRAFPTLSS